MKKVFKWILRIFGILLAIILVGVIAAVIYFWPFLSSLDWSVVTPDNIKALYVAFTNDADTLAENQKVLDEKRAEDIKNYVSVEVRDFTEEELKQIESGERTQTEIVAQIITESVELEEPTEVVSAPVTNNGETAPEQTPAPPVAERPVIKESADVIVARHIANLYNIQKEFEGRVSSLAASVKNWTHAYYKTANVSWRDAKVAAVKHFSSTASQIEQDCYARVDVEIAALENDLKAIGADLSIVSVVRESAYKEMELKKAQIVNEGTTKLNK